MNPERSRKALPPQGSQRGFSMVEMLVATFILSIGLLGLTALQTMALRTNSDSARVGLAVQIAELKLESLEGIARQRMLFTKTANPVPSARPAVLDGTPETLYFDGTGTLQASGGVPLTAPTVDTVYTLTTTATAEQPMVNGFGGISVFRTVATFVDGVDPNTNQPINKTVTLSRRIMYA